MPLIRVNARDEVGVLGKEGPTKSDRFLLSSYTLKGSARSFARGRGVPAAYGNGCVSAVPGAHGNRWFTGLAFDFTVERSGSSLGAPG